MINWHKLGYNYPEQVSLFYDWLALFVKAKKMQIPFLFSTFFKVPTFLQVAIFNEYLKDSMVEEFAINPLDESDCIQAIEDYLEAQTESAAKAKRVIWPMNDLFCPIEIEPS